MKYRIINLLKNPIGVGLAALHWLIALPALAYFPVDNFGHLQKSSETAMVIIIALAILDIPAIAFIALLLSPFYFLGITFDLLFILGFIASFVLITFQWLIVGRVISNFFLRTEPEIENLGITDNTLADNLDSSDKTELK